MQICVCVKRVPMVGGTIALTADALAVDTAMTGFTVSPHEECAVEEAIAITERLGGQVTVLTLGPPEATEQLRDMLALGAHRAVLLVTDGSEWEPIATAAAITAAIGPGRHVRFDLVLFGNEAADTGGYQVPVRVAHALGWPVATGIKALDTAPGQVLASREYLGVRESFELPLPAVVSVREGINLPRYPSLPGRLRAKRAEIEVIEPALPAQPAGAGAMRTERLTVPRTSRPGATVLGTGTAAVPALVGLLDELGVLGGPR